MIRGSFLAVAFVSYVAKYGSGSSYRSAPVIVACCYLRWMAFECWDSSLCPFFQSCAKTVKTPMGVLQFIGNEETSPQSEQFHTELPTFFYSFCFTMHKSSRISNGIAKDEGLKELCRDLFVKIAHFRDRCKTNALISHTVCNSLDPKRVLVSTQTGLCCNNSINPSSTENCSDFSLRWRNSLHRWGGCGCGQKMTS